MYFQPVLHILLSHRYDFEITLKTFSNRSRSSGSFHPQDDYNFRVKIGINRNNFSLTNTTASTIVPSLNGYCIWKLPVGKTFLSKVSDNIHPKYRAVLDFQNILK